MKQWIRRHSESGLVASLGLLVFAALNVLMLQTNYAKWTNPRVGFWSVFHKGFSFSGFDQHAYIIISKWRPLYTHLRHPMLNTFEWPLSELNVWLKDVTGMNCAIFIVAVLWTLLATASWLLLYKLLRRIVGLGAGVSLLLCLFHFSLAYVMLATFVPDHMILSMTLLLLTLYAAARARERGRAMRLWQSWALFFLATGVTTTNAVKVWLVDVVAAPRGWLRRSLLYLVPLALLAGLYAYQERTSIAEERESAARQVRQHIAKDSTFVKKMQARNEVHRRVTSNQIAEGALFEYTNNDIDRWRTLKDNIFGEGVQLHEDYLLQDANLEKRPVFVEYRHWWNDAVEAVVVVLFVAGLWCGRRQRLMWMAFAPFAFDMVLHVGLSFALFDVYIMTAHWAFAMPVAMAFLVRQCAERAHESTRKRWQYRSVIALVAGLALWLWWHNAHLIASHILKHYY